MGRGALSLSRVAPRYKRTILVSYTFRNRQISLAGILNVTYFHVLGK